MLLGLSSGAVSSWVGWERSHPRPVRARRIRPYQTRLVGPLRPTLLPTGRNTQAIGSRREDRRLREAGSRRHLGEAHRPRHATGSTAPARARSTPPTSTRSRRRSGSRRPTAARSSSSRSAPRRRSTRCARRSRWAPTARCSSPTTPPPAPTSSPRATRSRRRSSARAPTSSSSASSRPTPTAPCSGAPSPTGCAAR